MKTSEFCPKKLGWWGSLPQIFRAWKVLWFGILQARQRFLDQKLWPYSVTVLRFFFLQNWWKQVNFGLKNWVVAFRPGRFVELEECFDLVYYRPSNDFWIKIYGRIQSQFADFFSSKTDENMWIFASKIGLVGFAPSDLSSFKRASIWYIIGAATISGSKVIAVFSHSSTIFFSKTDENKWISA